MAAFRTPEEAARGDIPERFVRVVGVVVRGDEAVVAQLTNDGPPYEVETAYCDRVGGGWQPQASGNSTAAFIDTGAGMATLVVWDEARPGAAAARFECQGRAQVVPVENGAALAVFDDVKPNDADLYVPSILQAWIDDAGRDMP